MSKYKVALVGTGDWAKVHAAAWNKISDADLIGVWEYIDMQRLDDFANEFKIPNRYSDLKKMLKELHPDMVDIAANPHFRLEAIKDIVKEPSVKLINVEKPIALKPSDAYKIRELCRKYNKKLTVNHQKKFLPGWKDIKQVLDNKELGDIDFIRATCKGNLLEQGTHLVDMMLYYNNYNPPDWVMGQIDELEGLKKPGASAPDATIAIMQFKNGTRGIIECGTVGREVTGETNKWYKFSVEIYCKEGNAVVTFNGGFKIRNYKTGKIIEGKTDWENDYIEAMASHLKAGLKYIKDDGYVHISNLANSLVSFEIIMAVYYSAVNMKKVTFPVKFNDDIVNNLNKLADTKS